MCHLAVEPGVGWIVTAEQVGMWLVTPEKGGMWLVTAEKVECGS